MGPLPKTGEWVRLEVSPEQVGLKPGSKINGIAFTQWGGTIYWDAAGVNRSGIGLPQNLVDILQHRRRQTQQRTGRRLRQALSRARRRNWPTVRQQDRCAEEAEGRT